MEKNKYHGTLAAITKKANPDAKLIGSFVEYNNKVSEYSFWEDMYLNKSEELDDGELRTLAEKRMEQIINQLHIFVYDNKNN